MQLEELLSNFSNEQLLELIPEIYKEYLQKIEKKNIYKYILDNFITLLDDKKFVVDFFTISQNINCGLTNLIKLLNFIDGTLTKDSKNKILKFFNLKNDIKEESVETSYCNCVLSKRFYELLDYQFLIREKILNYIKKRFDNMNHINRLIIHMPTGTGKTKTAVHTTISLYHEYDNDGIIVWLAHTEELLNQAINAFKSAWEVLGDKQIKIFHNQVYEVLEKNGIYFLSYQKLISISKKNKELFESIRDKMTICICDEAHKCLATETYKSLESLMVSYNRNRPKTLIGLTATPGRKYKDSLLDGDNSNLALMFDKNIFSIDTKELEIFSNYNKTYIKNVFSYTDIFKKDDEIIKYFQNRGVLAKIKRFPLEYQDNLPANITKIFSKRRTQDYSNKELQVVGAIKSRNLAILDKLEQLANNSIPTIVFACSNEQGKLLSSILTLKGINNHCIFGDTNDLLRKKYISDFEQGKYDILINNAILTTGFDSPRIRCVFITRPTNSIVLYSQMLGRGLRGKKMGGNEECLLIDVIDNLNKFTDENFAFNYFSVYWR